MFGIDDPAVETAVRTYVKLMRAARAVTAQVEPALAANGLTTTQLGVLEALLHKGRLTHRDLGRKVLTSAANMTDVVDKLAARGLVSRIRCPQDRRLVHVDLTESGRALIEALFPVHARAIAAAMSGLDTATLAHLEAELRTLGMAAARATAELAAAPPLAEVAEPIHLPG